MTKKDYELIAGCIFRSGIIEDKNKVRQKAREGMRKLIVSDLCGTLKHDNPNFNEERFTKACGINYQSKNYMEKSIKQEFWQHIESKKGKTKIADKVYNWLNHDNLGDILVNNGIYRIELTWSGACLPNYVYNYIKKWSNKMGYTPLYDL